MHSGQSGAMLIPKPEPRVLHADRLEQMLREVIAEPLTAYSFDRLSDPIDVDPVIPPVAGIENQRERQCRVLTRDNSWDGLRFHVPPHIGIPDVVDEPGSVRDEMAQRDPPFGGAQNWLARAIEAFEHLWGREFRQDVRNGIIEGELALLDKLHRRSRSNSFAHRGDPEHRLG